MRFQSIVAALAVGAACFVAQSANRTFAQEEAKEEAKAEEATFDFSVFDVPEGKDEAFYADAFGKIIASFNASTLQMTMEEREKALEKMGSAMKTIYKGLENATEEALVERCNQAFQNYAAYTAVFEHNFGEIKSAFEEERASGKSKERASQAFFYYILGRLQRPNVTDDDYKAVGADLVANVNEVDPRRIAEITQLFLRIAPDAAKDSANQVVKIYGASEDETKQRMAKALEGTLRFASLVGNEMKVEGLYLDKTEIDWNSYRGKVVLVDFWATWCGPCVAEVPNVRALYEKYHDAGFEVLGYSVDEDIEALEKFEEEKKLPWKTASEKLSVEAKENGGKEYVNLSEYYGVSAIPTMILVDKDGKVVSINARGEELKRLLKKQFPDVK